jgi:uncharacterized alpha-E superfamily protein
MLSRTAENLYWTGRYMERAENMARILDVSNRAALQRPRPGAEIADWQAVLDILGFGAQFVAKYQTPSAAAVTAFFMLDPENPSSIYSSVRAARENARALRAAISNEMWETLNTTWLGIRAMAPADLERRGLREFCDWIKERSHLFRGVSHGTTLHDDAFHFLRLGTFLERADNTARLLDTKYHRLETAEDADEPPEEESPAASYYEWGAVLRAVSAFRAYHQVYHDVISPSRVAELLVLRKDMPRSLRFCALQVDNHLDHLAKGRDLDAQKLSGELYSYLRFARINRVLESGLHEFLTDVIARLAAVGLQVSKDFMMTV